LSNQWRQSSTRFVQSLRVNEGHGQENVEESPPQYEVRGSFVPAVFVDNRLSPSIETAK